MNKKFHVGLYLSEELEERKLNIANVADTLGISKSKLDDILSCKSDMTPSIAKGLEGMLGISSEYWMNLQRAWECGV